MTDIERSSYLYSYCIDTLRIRNDARLTPNADPVDQFYSCSRWRRRPFFSSRCRNTDRTAWTRSFNSSGWYCARLRPTRGTGDLEVLSARGHFLKGSSAALGLRRVQHSCEALQHFGKCLDAHGEGPPCGEDEALRRCRILLGRLVREQKDAKDVRLVYLSPPLKPHTRTPWSKVRGTDDPTTVVPCSGWRTFSSEAKRASLVVMMSGGLRRGPTLSLSTSHSHTPLEAKG